MINLRRIVIKSQAFGAVLNDIRGTALELRPVESLEAAIGILFGHPKVPPIKTGEDVQAERRQAERRQAERRQAERRQAEGMPSRRAPA